MKKAAIVIEQWKLPIFKDHLTKAGFTWSVAGTERAAGESLTVIHAMVEDADAARLAKTVSEALQEARKVSAQVRQVTRPK